MTGDGKAVGIFGATGLIGGAVAERLAAGGWSVIRFSRTPPEGEPGWRVANADPDLRGLHAVVNLAGESIARRWTRSAWKRIRESRIGMTRSIVEAMEGLPPEERPACLVNASAVGYYESSGDLELREDLAPGTGRLGKLCRDWELAAVEAESLGVRVVRLRTGIVLGAGGEAWERLRRVFRWGLGGRLGSGRQWMPWIHLADEARAIVVAVERDDLWGPLNLGSPEPVTNRDLTRRLGAALGRPAFLPVPGFVLRLGLGEFGETLLESYRMVPGRLEDLGFEFQFGTLKAALEDLVG